MLAIVFPDIIDCEREFICCNLAIRPRNNNRARYLWAKQSLVRYVKSFKVMIEKDTLIAALTLKYN
jgi:hypothetical protein